MTKVTIGVNDENNSPTNRWAIPFAETDFEKEVTAQLRDFKRSLNTHLSAFRVVLKERDVIPSRFCVYVPVETTLSKKAQNMVANNSYILYFLRQHDIKVVGDPFLEVDEWNLQDKTLKFNYCFPVTYRDSLPKHKEIQFKYIESKPALKAEYYGNYRTSDRAWFALYDHAQRNDIPVDLQPFEIFYDNPFMGGSELEWRAEVFLPLKE